MPKSHAWRVTHVHNYTVSSCTCLRNTLLLHNNSLWKREKDYDFYSQRVHKPVSFYKPALVPH